MEDTKEETITLTREQAIIAYGWSLSAGVGFVFGGSPDESDPAVKLQSDLKEIAGIE